MRGRPQAQPDFLTVVNLDAAVPAAVDVLGVAGAGSAVTVNAQSAYRRGEYFWQELSVANGTAPVATSVTVSAGGTPTTGKLVTPPANQSFTHDLDGNLTDDGVWTYHWDAENRLLAMEHKTNVLADSAVWRKLAFEYDARGRRIRRQELPWQQGGWNPAPLKDTKFLYDGWNLLAELDARAGDAVLRTYMWGLDLSGTPQGAGGVGGLLAGLTGTTAQFAAYDGNGNVRALADGTSGAWSAQYEHGPFGELLRATGPQARANPFRFSTKWHDDESDLLYYGFRYYQPGMGRWLSRDPIGEEGGVNLYGFLRNNAVSQIDILGLAEKKTQCICGPDVSYALLNTLQEVRFIYDGWSFRQKWNACQGLYNVFSGYDGSDAAPTRLAGSAAAIAWDIRELFMLGADPALPTGICDRTVTFLGKCYYSGSANYALWGTMNSLCSRTFQNNGPVGLWSLPSASVAVHLWKTSRYKNRGATYRQALEFTRFGYGMGFPSSGLPSCKIDQNRTIPHRIFNWNWLPNRDSRVKMINLLQNY